MQMSLRHRQELFSVMGATWIEQSSSKEIRLAMNDGIGHGLTWCSAGLNSCSLVGAKSGIRSPQVGSHHPHFWIPLLLPSPHPW